MSTIRSRRLPHFQFSALGGELLQPFDFTFAKGVFGTYPGIGPIPSTNAKVHTPAQLTAYLNGSMDVPLLQQYKIGLGIRATELGRDIAKEDVRAERQKIAAEVRSAYFELVATQAAVDAAREGVRTLEEAQRVTLRYIAEKTVLKGDALEVDARLTKAQYDLSVAENGLATQHEHLNQLLARDLETPFRVDFIPEEDTTTLSLEEARQQASQNRPEIRQAHLEGKTSRLRPPHCEGRIHTGPRYRRQLHGDSERAGPSDECRSGRLCVDLGAIRLGTPPQSSTRKIQHPSASPQRCTRDRIASRG